MAAGENGPVRRKAHKIYLRNGSFSSLIVVSLLFLAKYFFGIFLYLRIIDYFRLKIDDLRNVISSERRSEATSTNRQLSIFNFSFLVPACPG
jgi:hypothetical protein